MYYNPKERMFFITSTDSVGNVNTGMTIALGTHCTDTTWTWEQTHCMKEEHYVCEIVDLFKAIEKKMLDNDKKK